MPALGLDVLGAEDGADQCYAVCAAAGQLQQIVGLDAANGDHRQIHSLADLPQGLVGQGRASALVEVANMAPTPR